MTQVEIENVLREFNAELQSERSRKIDQIEKAHLMKVQAIDAELSAKIAELEFERDKAQEEMMSAKIAWINAGTDEQKTAMQVQFERTRFEQEKKCRHIRARIDELKRIARVDQARAVSDRNKLMGDNNERFAAKYNAKRAELNKEITPSNVKSENKYISDGDIWLCEDTGTRSGYINIYFEHNDFYGKSIYPTYEEAERRGKESGFYVTTTKIEFNEKVCL